MANVTIWYEGDLSTRAVHEENHSELLTDAPKDNQGLGRVFSPTDLIAVALGSCALTLMGIAARNLGIEKELKGTRAVAFKEMSKTLPRRIDKVRIEIFCPHSFQEEVRMSLVKAAENCPVLHSLHPNMIKEFIYHWGAL